jgi:hypothetical protein
MAQNKSMVFYEVAYIAGKIVGQREKNRKGLAAKLT